MTNLLLLLIAISSEVAATTLLKASHGLTRLKPTIGVGVGYLISLFLLSHVLKSLPVGPVYAAWAGIGTAGAAVVGVLAFGERLPPGAWAGIALVGAGVVLLGYYAPHQD